MDITRRLNNNDVDNGDVEVYPSDYPFESTSESVPNTDTTMIKSIYDDEMDQILKLSRSYHDDGILDVDLQVIQDLIVVAPFSILVSTVFIPKYRGEIFSVTNCMSHFSMFVPTKANVKLAMKKRNMLK